LRAAIQVVEMLVIIAALVAVVGGVLYGFSLVMLTLVSFFPTIGKRHRHEKWDELNKRSGRSSRFP
jgi:hypothetical protein